MTPRIPSEWNVPATAGPNPNSTPSEGTIISPAMTMTNTAVVKSSVRVVPPSFRANGIPSSPRSRSPPPSTRPAQQRIFLPIEIGSGGGAGSLAQAGAKTAGPAIAPTTTGWGMNGSSGGAGLIGTATSSGSHDGRGASVVGGAEGAAPGTGISCQAWPSHQ